MSQDKPIWITEAGWPVSGPTENQAVPSTDNSKTYWDEVGCDLFNRYNIWWYILRDNNASPAPNPSFGIVGLELGEPLFDLTCPAGSSGASESSSARDEEVAATAESVGDAADDEAAATAEPVDDSADDEQEEAATTAESADDAAGAEQEEEEDCEDEASAEPVDDAANAEQEEDDC